MFVNPSFLVQLLPKWSYRGFSVNKHKYTTASSWYEHSLFAVVSPKCQSRAADAYTALCTWPYLDMTMNIPLWACVWDFGWRGRSSCFSNRKCCQSCIWNNLDRTKCNMRAIQLVWNDGACCIHCLLWASINAGAADTSLREFIFQMAVSRLWNQRRFIKMNHHAPDDIN